MAEKEKPDAAPEVPKPDAPKVAAPKAETPVEPKKVTLADHVGSTLAVPLEKAQKAGDGTLSSDTDKKGIRWLVADLILTEPCGILEALNPTEQAQIKAIAQKLKS